MGDGGYAGDPQNRAQNRKNLLGKMLRIDINNGNPYSIPPTNPFVNDTANYRPEIWALGLRNPWRFSFDRQTGDLWIGDVGQGNWEEIHLQAAASKGGENYGWRCYEGNADYNTSGCNAKNTYTFPVYAYSHSSNNDCSITGGYLYRGIKYPALQGTYIYTDYCSGLFRALRSNGQGGWTNTDLVKAAFGFVTFGEDKNGELYVANANNGTIYQIIGSTTATKDVLQIGNLTLAPNPAADFIRISMDALETGTYQFRLLDATGRALSEWREGVATGYVKDIATKELPVGLYFLQVQKDGQTLTRKFQKGG
jgi:hypothetical protein